MPVASRSEETGPRHALPANHVNLGTAAATANWPKARSWGEKLGAGATHVLGSRLLPRRKLETMLWNSRDDQPRPWSASSRSRIQRKKLFIGRSRLRSRSTNSQVAYKTTKRNKARISAPMIIVTMWSIASLGSSSQGEPLLASND